MEGGTEGPTLRGEAGSGTGLGAEGAANPELFHHHRSRALRENVKASENAQRPKGSVGSHMFRILGKIKLNFRCKKIELLMKSKEGEDW